MAEGTETLFDGTDYPIAVTDSGFEIDDKSFESKERAVEYRAKLIEAEELAAQPDLSDLLPEGYVDVRREILKFRNSLLELPMNETHLPDGSLNPYYDRRWHWGWAANYDTDVADKQSLGYELVSREQYEELVEEGTAPSHYLNMLRPEAGYLLHGDLVLMRMPRVLWRQIQAEKTERATESFKRDHEKQQEAFAQAGMKEAEAPFKNELSLTFNN